MAEDRYIEVGSLNVRYQTFGEEGPCLVLIHGLGGSADVWMHNVEALSAGHRLFIPDLAGFGGSDAPGPSFSPFDYARFLDDFMAALGIEGASLVGHSLGGGIALLYTLTYPEKVKKLVLVDSAGLGREVIWTLRAMSLPFIGELCSRPTRKRVELFFRFAVRNRALITKEFVEIYYRFFSRPGFRPFLLGLLRLIVTVKGARGHILSPIVDNLWKIDHPVLVVWGSEDRVLPLKHGRFAEQRLPNAKLEVVEGCGHLPFFERPDAFNRLVLTFLDG